MPVMAAESPVDYARVHNRRGGSVPGHGQTHMNAADQELLNWLNAQINTGKRAVTVPATLLENTTPEGRDEARRLAKLCGVELTVRA